MVKLKYLFTGSQRRCLYTGHPKRYKRNAINGDLNRSYQSSMNFDHEKEIFRQQYHLAGSPSRFFDSAIHQFHQELIDEQAEYELIIPDFLFVY